MRHALLLMVLGWGLLTACAPAPPPTLILAAFEVELQPLRAALTGVRTLPLPAPLGEGTAGLLDGHPVVLVTTGAGMVNAAMHAQAAIGALHPARVVMLGTAGALDPSLPVGAVVVPAAWVHHGMGRLDASGFAPVAQAGPYAVDMRLLDTAAQLNGVLVGGVGASGDVFVADPDARDALAQRTGARIVDMETAAVAQVSARHNLPFIGVRAVSDDAAGGASDAAALADGVQRAAQAACDAVRALLTAHPPN